MEAIAFVLGFVVLGALALRFGQDSREGIRSQEHALADSGMTWVGLMADRGRPVATAGAGDVGSLRRDLLAISPEEFAAFGLGRADEAAASVAHKVPATALAQERPSCPTLAFIERALDSATGTLTDLPDAERLEARARQLTTEYWSDLAWTTGVVPEAAVHRVLAELVPAFTQVPVLSVERPSAIVEPVEVPQPAIVAERQPAARQRTASLGLAGSPASV